MKALVEDLLDLKLLGRLSKEDLVAREANNHSKCFLNLFNGHRKHVRNTTMESNDSQDNLIEGVNNPYLFQT